MPNMKTEFVDRAERWSLTIDRDTQKTYVAIAVTNSSHVEYDEWYAVDEATFATWVAEPTLAADFVSKAKRRELDHLLLLEPGTDRGVADVPGTTPLPTGKGAWRVRGEWCCQDCKRSWPWETIVAGGRPTDAEVSAILATVDASYTCPHDVRQTLLQAVEAVGGRTPSTTG